MKGTEMTTELSKQVAEMDPAELNSLLGPTPVWSTEKVEDYYKMLNKFMAALGVRDFVEMMLIRDVTVATWEIIRYTRQKTLAVDRKFRQRLEVQAQKAKEVNERREMLRGKLADKGDKAQTPTEHAENLVNFVEQTPEDINAILRQTPDDLDHARALEEAFEHHDRLNRAMEDAIEQRNGALELLERYREGLGSMARSVSNQVIEADYSETTPSDQIEAPPVAPS